MALFHLSVTQTKRSAGQSAIASAAYRAGERLYSEYYGEYSDYTRKGGVICSDIFFFIIPSGESYCNDRSKEFSENKNIYERRTFYYGNYKNHAASCRQRPHRESGNQ